MEWIKNIDYIEIILIFLFLFFYFLYFVKIKNIDKNIPVNFDKILIKFLLRSIYFCLFILSILGPSFGESKKEIEIVGKDIMIAIDLSESMNANDIQPSRLEKIKFELKNIVKEFYSDRIGIVMFSNDAFVQCPLTYDKNALNLFIETLNTGLVPNTGTDFGPPLKISLDKLKNNDSKPNTNKSKIILLISDGEDFGENTDQHINNIKNSSIKLFTLGIGTEKGITLISSNGKIKKDQNGDDVITKLNSISLKKIASMTNGKYYEITNNKNEIKQLINQINSLEGNIQDSIKLDISKNKYHYFLLIGIFLFVIDFLFTFKVLRI
tara:strand:- start:449 stop:1420 length:972 start_codon:yes stop_codon:yes gene_type:complete